MFKTIKPRKAKFGFKMVLNGNLDDILVAADGIRFIRGEGAGRCWTQITNSMGTAHLTVYSDDEEFAEAFGAKFSDS